MAQSDTPSAFRKKAIGALQNLYDKSSDLTESVAHEPSGKRMLAAAALSTMLQSGLNKVSSTGSAAGHYGIEQRGGHFTDRVIEKVLDVALAPKDRRPIEEKLTDPHRTKRPRLSVRTLFGNFKRLSARLDILFRVQYGIVRISSWDDPSLTLTALVLYSFGCVYPHLLLMYPAVWVLGYSMIPAYLNRHPLARRRLIPLRSRGGPALGFFAPDTLEQDDKSKGPAGFRDRNSPDSDGEEALTAAVLMDISNDSDGSIILDDSQAESQTGSQAESQPEQTAPTTASPVNPILPDETPPTPNKTARRVDLLLNMRDLQNLTGDVIGLMDSTEQFFYSQAGFSDEVGSTVLFFRLWLYVAVVFFLGPFIPWRSIFVVMAWVGLGFRLPKVKELVKLYKVRQQELRNRKEATDAESARNKGPDREVKTDPKLESQPKPLIKQRMSESIIVDEPPEVEEVEVFEIEQRSFTSTEYNPVCFSPSAFDADTEERMHRWRPAGVPMLEEVLPPTGWRFNSSEDWNIDTNPATWCLERYLKLVPADEGWAYDEQGDFRRRRLVRFAHRLPKPPLHPGKAAKDTSA
ncbi:unnamed protein product [Kuraishia capsulata CBS 1993]|uniref:TECPR1-like DysF domain-containing protein n=1 Tax=Kuraishia capsulata CBS 1993 TaxID=1382522 RepID=W6MUT2_9ASCO|nr:uncharacterized protein KUCA_T00001871001 [Kuraishia capsulata CBS 1993]CDK25900.1 unnamed protein product [Kuraishia capsulata CBS 1993]